MNASPGAGVHPGLHIPYPVVISYLIEGRNGTPMRTVRGLCTTMISPETGFVLLICFLDMFSSAYLFHYKLATEANILLRPYAEAGVLPFMSAKLLTFLPALAVAEWYRPRRPDLVVPLVRWVGIVYVTVYVVAVIAQWPYLAG